MMFPMSHAGVPDLTLQKLSRDREPLMPTKSSPAPRATSHDDEKDAIDASETSDPMEEKEVSLTTTSPEPPQDPATPPPTKQKQKQRAPSTNTATISKSSRAKKPANTPLDLQVLAAMGDQTAKAKSEKQRRPKYRKLAKTEEGRRDLSAWRSLGDGLAREVLEGFEMRGRGRTKKGKGKEGEVECEGSGGEEGGNGEGECLC